MRHPETVVVQSQLLQQSRVKIGHCHPILSYFISQLIRGAVNVAPSEAASGEQEGSSVAIVIPSALALSNRETAKFSTPQHHGGIQ